MATAKKSTSKTSAKTAAAKKTAPKSATKSAAEKKTAPKTAAAKSATAKKATAKSAAAKTAAPKTVAAKSVAPKKSATEISVNGNKKISTLQKEFTKKFPYLGIYIFDISMKPLAAVGQTIWPLPADKTLASVRRVNTGGEISINGHKKIGNLEAEFDKVFGLYIQVCTMDTTGKKFYTSAAQDAYSLTAYNSQCEQHPMWVRFSY